jgi:hypothetical protein
LPCFHARTWRLDPHDDSCCQRNCVTWIRGPGFPSGTAERRQRVTARLRTTILLRAAAALCVAALGCGGGTHSAIVPEIQPSVTASLDLGTSGVVIRLRVRHECSFRQAEIDEEGHVVKKGALMAHAFACEGGPLRSAPIELVVGDREIAVGETDERGELYCNLETALRVPGKSEAERPPTGTFVYKDPRLGVVPLASISLARVYEALAAGQ